MLARVDASLHRAGHWIAGLALIALVASACASDQPPRALTSNGVAVSASSAGSPAPQPAESSPSTRPSPTPTEYRFQGSIVAIDAATRTRMRSSWHPGCPVPLEDLRLLSLSYWGFDGKVHDGELVVHRDVAEDVLTVFGAIFRERFPIRRMRLVDDYGGDDARSMAANNTSAFNCRPVTGGTSWSEHSYGRAIDLDPVQNPYVTAGGVILPAEGAGYADRSLHARGMIHAGGAVVAAFGAVGWSWGGEWSSPADYQHFSSTGR